MFNSNVTLGLCHLVSLYIITHQPKLVRWVPNLAILLYKAWTNFWLNKPFMVEWILTKCTNTRVFPSSDELGITLIISYVTYVKMLHITRGFVSIRHASNLFIVDALRLSIWYTLVFDKDIINEVCKNCPTFVWSLSCR